jgi:hypothetical protein
MALISTLVDNYEGAFDTGLWTVTLQQASSAYSQAGGVLALTGPPNGAGSGWVIIDSIAYYDPVADSVYVSCPQMAARALLSASVEAFPLVLWFDATNALEWRVSNNTLEFRTRISNAFSTIFSTTYSATTHRWFRVRESGGLIYCDTASSSASDPPAGGDWTNRGSVSYTPPAFARVRYIVGKIDSEASDSGTMQIGSINAATGAAVISMLRPDATSAAGGWLNNLGGSDLHTGVNEAGSPIGSSYIISGANPVADTCKLGLSNFVSFTPSSLTFRYEYYKYETGGTGTLNLRARLLEGTTERGTWTHSNVATGSVIAQQTVSGASFTAITDLDNLFVEFCANP